MIQNLATLEFQSKKLNKKIQEGAFIQKVQSTPTTFTLRVRIPGETLVIHLGRGRGVEGMWLDETPPHKDFRIKDRFDDWLKNNLIGQKITKVETDKKYRILNFNLISKRGNTLFSLFYKGRNLNFVFKSEEFIFKSWIGKKEEDLGVKKYTPSEIYKGIYEGPEEKAGEVKLCDIQDHYNSLVSKKSDNRKRKLIEKKLLEIERGFENIEKAQKLQQLLYGFNIDQTEKEFKKINLKIKKKYDENEFQFRDRAFQKIKNLKKSFEFLKSKKEKLKNEFDNLSEVTHLKKVNLPNWLEKSGRKLKDKSILEFTLNDKKGALGKNIKGNDYLRNQFGTKSDTWFHLENEKSCHVVLKIELSSIDGEIAELIGSLIRDSMKKNSTELRLIYTSLSNIKGLKGKSGAVTITNPNYFKVLYNPKWKEIISLD